MSGGNCVDCQEVVGVITSSAWRHGGAKVTPEEHKQRDNDIIRLTLAGKTLSQIARTLGISTTTVSVYRSKLGVRNPRISRRDYSKRATSEPRDLDGEFALQVEADVDRGFTASASANKHGVSRSTIAAWRKALENRER